MWNFWPVCCFTRGPQDNGKEYPCLTVWSLQFSQAKNQPRLTHTLQGLSRSQLAAPELLSALKGRAQQLSHVLFGTLVKRNFWDEIFGSDPKRLEFGCLFWNDHFLNVFSFSHLLGSSKDPDRNWASSNSGQLVAWPCEFWCQTVPLSKRTMFQLKPERA